jgi:hypothetical protein
MIMTKALHWFPRLGRMALLLLPGWLLALPVGADTDAAQRAARAMLVRGEVAVTDARGQSRALQKDDLVRLGDTLETGPRGFLQLVFDDRMILALKANSQLRVESFHFDPADPAADASVTQLLKGGMRAVTGLLGSRSPDQVKFQTRLATIGIRGTAIDLEESEGDVWRVTFDFGQGYVETEAGQADLAAGQSVRHDADGAPAPFDFERPAEDPATLARTLPGLGAEGAEARIAGLVSALPEQDLLLALCLLHQGEGFRPELMYALLRGAAGVLPVERRADLAGLAVRLHPAEAKEILTATFKDQGAMVPILFAMVRALEGVPNGAVDALLNHAMKLGLSPLQVFELMDRLKKNPLVCD